MLDLTDPAVVYLWRRLDGTFQVEQWKTPDADVAADLAWDGREERSAVRAAEPAGGGGGGAVARRRL